MCLIIKIDQQVVDTVCDQAFNSVVWYWVANLIESVKPAIQPVQMVLIPNGKGNTHFSKTVRALRRLQRLYGILRRSATYTGDSYGTRETYLETNNP